MRTSNTTKTVTDRRGSRRFEKGAVSIETALVFPFLLAMLLLLTQFVFLVFAKRTAQAAAEHGAEQAAFHQASNADGHQAIQEAVTQIPGLKNVKSVVDRSDTAVLVTVEGSPIRLLPIDMSVSATSSAHLEQIVDVGERQ